MLRSELRYFKANIGGIDHVRINALHFMAGYYGICFSGLGPEVAQVDAPLDLFKSAHRNTLLLQGAHATERIGPIFPLHRVLGSQGCLMYLRRRRSSRDAAQHHSIDQKGVGCAEYSSYIIKRPHIVEHNYKGQFATGAILLYSVAPEVTYGLFFHDAGKFISR